METATNSKELLDLIKKAKEGDTIILDERIKCEVCGSRFNKDGICDNCGLPSKDAFLKALEQAIKKPQFLGSAIDNESPEEQLEREAQWKQDHSCNRCGCFECDGGCCESDFSDDFLAMENGLKKRDM